MTKTILITGAGRGIGRQLALTFAAAGWQTALNDITPINVEETAAQITAQGGKAAVFVQDISKKISAQALAGEVNDTLGTPQAIAHCARVRRAEPLLVMDEWDLHRMMEVNLMGTLAMLQTFGRELRPQGGGVFLSAFPLAGPQEAPAAAFLASQMALATLIAQAAPELAAAGLRLYGLTSGQPQLQTQTHTFTSLPQAALALCQNSNLPTGSLLNF